MKRKRSRRSKRGTHASSKSGTFVYKSSWELQYALYLDADQDVILYCYEPYAISYISNKRTGRKRRYFPDFEVTMSDGSVLLVEIKPKRKLTLLTNIKKFAAASAFCVAEGKTFKVVTETDLKALGLLK